MKIALLATALALPVGGAAPPTEPTAPSARHTPSLNEQIRNVYPGAGPDCIPIPVQVAGERREYHGSRLDQQPPARLLLAVDRRVNGCPVATIVGGSYGLQAADPERRR